MARCIGTLSCNNPNTSIEIYNSLDLDFIRYVTISHERIRIYTLESNEYIDVLGGSVPFLLFLFKLWEGITNE